MGKCNSERVRCPLQGIPIRPCGYRYLVDKYVIDSLPKSVLERKAGRPPSDFSFFFLF